MKIHGNREWLLADMDRVIKMRRSMTLREIGAIEGVSAARIGQIIGKTKFCRSCWEQLPDDERKRTCPECEDRARAKPCRRCGKPFTPLRGDASAYCAECRWERRRCTCGCGKVIVRPRRRYNTERLRWFHSHRAWGEWKRKMKYDWRKEKRAA